VLGWFAKNVLTGDLGDLGSYGRGAMNFARNFPSSRIMGNPADDLTAERMTRAISQTRVGGTTGAFRGTSMARVLGPIGFAVGLGVSMYEGIQGFREAKQNNADTPEKAYFIFSTVGGGIGGGICAAIDVKQKGGTPRKVTAAFFAGLAGAYTPGQPLIGSFKADERDRATRIGSLDVLRAINIPARNGDTSFNANTHRGSTALYNGRHDPKLEDAFLDWLERYHPTSDLLVERIEGASGEYRTSSYFGDETYFSGEQWEWGIPGDLEQMPLWGVRDGFNPPLTGIHELEIKGRAMHPTPTPDLVATPEDEGYNPGDWGS